jgi:hypothetical protein
MRHIRLARSSSNVNDFGIRPSASPSKLEARNK